MFGYRMTATESEQLHLRHLFADAMARRAPVRVSFFKERKLKGRPTGQYVKVTRVVEPYGFHVSATGKRSVLVVDRTPDGTWGPEYRSVRLDRIAYSRAQNRPLITRMVSQGYMCPTMLDHRPLHPTKRQLSAAA